MTRDYKALCKRATPSRVASIFDVFNTFPDEVPLIRYALIRGKIDGGWFWSTDHEGGCLHGTIRKARGEDVHAQTPMRHIPAQSFVMPIDFGDTPDTSAEARALLAMIDDWQGQP